MSTHRKKNKAKAARKDAADKPAYSGLLTRWWPMMAFVFLLYSNTLSHEFALDDVYVIQNNPLVRQGISGIPELLTTDYWEGPLGENKVSKLYRPLSLVTFAIEQSLTGLNPAFSHLVNVLLYGLLCVLVLKVMLQLFRNYPRWVPVAVSFLFAAHPLHTESVANLKGRAEILAGVFLFLSLLKLLEFIRLKQNKPLVLSSIFFFLGLLSKEDAITYTAVIPLVLWFSMPGVTIREFIKRTYPVLLLFAGLAGLMLLMRQSFADVPEKSFSYLENPLLLAEGPAFIITVLHVTGNYLIQLFIPHYLIHDYSFSQIPVSGSVTALAITGIITLGLFTFFGIRNTLHRRMSGFSMLYFLITFSVASNLIVTIGVMKAERLMFLPLLGPVMLISLGAYYLVTKHLLQSRHASVIIILIVLLFSIHTYSRNPDWKNNESLITADIGKSLSNVKTRANYAGILRSKAAQLQPGPQRSSLLSEAKVHLLESTVIAPEYNRPWIDLGYIYEMTGRYDSAAVVYQKAWELYDNDYNLLQRLMMSRALADPDFYQAKMLTDNNRFTEALPMLEELVQKMPDNAEVLYYAGGANFSLGNLARAQQLWQKAAGINPADQRINGSLELVRKAISDQQ